MGAVAAIASVLTALAPAWWHIVAYRAPSSTLWRRKLMRNYAALAVFLAVLGTAVTAGAAPSPSASSWTIGLTSNRVSRDTEVYAVRSDGTGARRLTRSPFFDGFPVRSPSGKKVAFYSQRSPKGDVWVMNADGSRARNLTRSVWHDAPGSWSPDGRRFAFDSDRTGNEELYVMNADGSGQRGLATNPAQDWNPQWSPDGHTILFASDRDGNADIYAMDAAATSEPRNLTNGAAPDGDGANGFLWSPDGRLIAFTTSRDRNTEIYVMRADGTEPRRLTRSGEDENLLAWSPDSRRIAFQRSASKPRWAFFVMNADGSGVRKVAWTLPRSS